jgi:hypothetical protein
MSGRTFIARSRQLRRWAIASVLVRTLDEPVRLPIRQPTAAHVPAPARTTTNATKSVASIVDRVQLVGIVDNSGTQLE